jgi:hypothetical protein
VSQSNPKCQQEEIIAGHAYPKSCEICGLGPCAKTLFRPKISSDEAEISELSSGEHDPLTIVLPCGYEDEIPGDILRVMQQLRDVRPSWYEAIALHLQLDKKYVHFILEVLASKDFTEYGSSPRGSWLTDAGEALLKLAEEWRAKA